MFFNGCKPTDYAKTMASKTSAVTPYPLIKSMASDPNFWASIQPILDGELSGLDFQVALTEKVRSLNSTLETFTWDATFKATAKVINAGSKMVATDHGNTTYERVVGGKIKTIPLVLTHSTAPQAGHVQ
jgi:hypothetical protein